MSVQHVGFQTTNLGCLVSVPKLRKFQFSNFLFSSIFCLDEKGGILPAQHAASHTPSLGVVFVWCGTEPDEGVCHLDRQAANQGFGTEAGDLSPSMADSLRVFQS